MYSFSLMVHVIHHNLCCSCRYLQQTNTLQIKSCRKSASIYYSVFRSITSTVQYYSSSTGFQHVLLLHDEYKIHVTVGAVLLEFS